MGKKVIALIMVCIVGFSTIAPTKVNAAMKLNVKSKTLEVGQSITLKVKGTKKKVKWSSGNKKVASVTKKGKVTAKKAGSATIKAKVGKKILKCKIKVRKKTIPEDEVNPEEISTAEITNNISYNLLNTKNGVVAILENNNEVTVSVSAKLAYYKDGGMIDTKSDYNFAFEAGRQCALFFDAPYNSSTYVDVDYDDYRMTFSAELASENIICGSSTILVNSSPGAGNISAEIVNASGKDFSLISLACVFYDSAGNAIGYEEQLVQCYTNGSTDFVSFDFPQDKNHRTIRPNSYKIYVNSAYRYNWE